MPLPATRNDTPFARYEVIIPRRYEGDKRIPLAHVKSTLLIASLASLRAMNWEQRYYDVLPPRHASEMRALLAGSWVPVELAMAHYGACDRMKLTPDELASVGEQVSEQMRRTSLALVGRASSEAGVTPWFVLGQFRLLWERVFNGGDHAIYKVGPKEAYFEVLDFQLLKIPYFRVACRAYLRVLVGFMAKSVYATEMPRFNTDRRWVFRFSWV